MEVPSCGTENAATAGVSATLSTGIYGVVDVDVRFDAQCGFFRTGAGMCISVCGYGIDWWVVWVVGIPATVVVGFPPPPQKSIWQVKPHSCMDSLYLFVRGPDHPFLSLHSASIFMSHVV